VAAHSSELIVHGPHASRDEFLAQVDDLIGELEEVRCREVSAAAAMGSPSISLVKPLAD
jgi:hypothetical protein